MKDFGSKAKTVGGNEGDKCKYPTRLDTYGCGCGHDCKYCYAKSLLDFRGLWNPSAPSIGDLRQIAREIKKAPRGSVLRLGGMTDCFQPAEKLHRVTYRAIRLLNKYRVPYLIVTKSAMVADPEYLEILDPELAHVQITITTLDDALAAEYEKASKPSDRVKAIYLLQERGIDCAVRISPMIPGYCDLTAFNALKIHKAVVEFLRVNAWIEKWFKIDYSDYTVQHGGYRHLPLEKKIELIKGLEYEEMTVCEDEDRAYEYWKNNFNANPDDCCNLRQPNTTLFAR